MVAADRAGLCGAREQPSPQERGPGQGEHKVLGPGDTNQREAALSAG